MPSRWTDSHCHVPYEGVGVDVIADAQRAGVERLVTVGTDAAQSRAAIDASLRSAVVWNPAPWLMMATRHA